MTIDSIAASGYEMIKALAAKAQPRRQQATEQAPQAVSRDQDGDGDNDAAGTEVADRVARQSFFQALKDNGISPEQFRMDLLAAIQSSENGQSDPATAFQNMPAGLGLDTMA